MTKALPLDKRYYYSQLTSEEDRRFYRFVLECIKARKLKFYYISNYLENALSDVNVDYPRLIYEDIASIASMGLVYEAILWDFPEFFYINTENMLTNEFEPTIDVSIPHGYTEAQIERLNKQLDKIYHSFDGIESGFALEVAVNDYIIKNYSYDYDAEHYKGKRYHEAFTVAGLLKYKKAVCAGFTRLAQYIFQRRGMEVAVLLTNPPLDIKAHCWLAVKLRGKYYHLDITLNMTEAREPYSIQNTHFNITDSELLKDEENYKPDDYKAVKCSSKRDNYYYASGLYLKNGEEVMEAVARFAAENSSKCGSVYFYFRVPRRMSERSVAHAMRLALRGIRRKMSGYLNSDGYYALEIIFNEEDEAT